MDEIAFLGHRQGDSVAVAVRDVAVGQAEVAFLDGGEPITIASAQRVPFGHKVALVNLAEGEPVIEYGEPVGIASTPMRVGELVHVHNMRSARWPQSA
ncbi:MAG: UxaA family hydrolase [Actinobacteria bacterium]|nr:UxaA family hydrolase [Actinomycetota bacterium]